MADNSERTLPPSEHKLREQRREGNVAKSTDLVGWLIVLVGVTIMPLVAAGVYGALSGTVELFAATVESPSDVAAMIDGATRIGVDTLVALAVPFAVFCTLAVVATIAQTGPLAAVKKLKPDPKRLNPLEGVKRLVSKQGLLELGKQLLRFALIAAVAYPAVRRTTERLVSGGRTTLWNSVEAVAADVLGTARLLAILGVTLGVIDYVLQKRIHLAKMRMSHQEVKDEQRNHEGDPHTKAHLRNEAHAMFSGSLAAVPEATAVVVNPTHYAIALRYTPGGDVPVVVAKGLDGMALTIRELAAKNKVPVVVAPPLARALHHSCDVGMRIPTELVLAVAALLAYVMNLGGKARRAAPHRLPAGSRYPVPGGLPTARQRAAEARRDAVAARREREAADTPT